VSRARLEYFAVRLVLALTEALPYWLVHGLANAAADLAFALLPRRRRLARANLAAALTHVGDPRAGDAAAVRRLARASCRSFALTAMPEVVALRRQLTAADAAAWLARRNPEAAAVFARARELHEATGGCVFVTPHLGSWELLPYVAGIVGIPLAVAIRPLDNPLLDDLLGAARRASGQVFLARGQALEMLKLHLRRGRSVALLADQATSGGLALPFFGRPAMTTPLPALLALRCRRPIVVAACVRVAALTFRGVLGEPLWPQDDDDERREVERLTAAMNRAMEEPIAAHPDQYLWLHDRWKSYG
jgi:KDO2-lipid IV(A) lauroyltransferase